MSASVPPVWCKQRGASAVLPMQAEAIDWAKNLNPGKSAALERVRNTDRDPDRWRKGDGSKQVARELMHFVGPAAPVAKIAPRISQ
jgi:hypothetical protein